ncbi:uncharacterized protein LOC133902405 [Phragmites australis]|uniref:uncharacterized protein LOC133902405 n=1 Tax=Phragmites australis TaxID=29695 RepID=UPI002D793BFA|nr:uncharacterized protein LOC133902405 [Phragmites australis]
MSGRDHRHAPPPHRGHDAAAGTAFSSKRRRWGGMTGSPCSMVWRRGAYESTATGSPSAAAVAAHANPNADSPEPPNRAALAAAYFQQQQQQRPPFRPSSASYRQNPTYRSHHQQGWSVTVNNPALKAALAAAPWRRNCPSTGLERVEVTVLKCLMRNWCPD